MMLMHNQSLSRSFSNPRTKDNQTRDNQSESNTEMINEQILANLWDDKHVHIHLWENRIQI